MPMSPPIQRKNQKKAELIAWEQNTFNVSRGIEYASYAIFGGFLFFFFSFFFQFENSPITESYLYIYITRYYSLSRERIHKNVTSTTTQSNFICGWLSEHQNGRVHVSDKESLTQKKNKTHKNSCSKSIVSQIQDIFCQIL